MAGGGLRPEGGGGLDPVPLGRVSGEAQHVAVGERGQDTFSWADPHASVDPRFNAQGHYRCCRFRAEDAGRFTAACPPIGTAPGLTTTADLAILLAMALSEHLSLADVKNRLSEVVDKLEREHGRVVMTKHGQPAAVMLNVDDLESLEETLAILSNPTLRDAILEGAADVAAGRTERLSQDQALARITNE